MIETVILIRLDDMDTELTIAQRAIRYEVDIDSEASISQQIADALAQAPPPDEWTASGFPS